VISPVGLINFLAVMGVRADPGVGTVPAVPVEDVEGVELVFQESAVLPSLLRDFGAGGAK